MTGTDLLEGDGEMVLVSMDIQDFTPKCNVLEYATLCPITVLNKVHKNE